MGLWNSTMNEKTHLLYVAMAMLGLLGSLVEFANFKIANLINDSSIFFPLFVMLFVTGIVGVLNLNRLEGKGKS